jgi:hypothetical protein
MVDAMSVENELTVTPEGTPGFEADPELEEPVEVLPQAAATRPAVATRVTRLIVDKPWDPWPLIPCCKRIRPVPSEPDPPFATPPVPVATSAAHTSTH